MANAGGNAPQNTPKPKKEYTDEQKRTMTLLVVMGVLAIVVGVIYIPPMLSGGGSDTLPVAPGSASGGLPVAPGTTPAAAISGMESASSALPGAPDGGAPTTTAVSAPAGSEVAAFGIPPKHRNDPFVPFVKEPPYLPPAPQPIRLPSPQVITLARPASALQMPAMNMPAVSIPRFNAQTTTPPNNIIPPRSEGSQPEPAYDKRLSGVVIANGVRALLEVDDGISVRTYVVQPGDSVAGITVLSIQRTIEGGRTLTRMLIREDGKEKFVDLKAGTPRADAGAAGGGLEGGLDGGGAFPGGAGGIFPGR